MAAGKHFALICTHGFADVLTLGRQHRADLYGAHVGPSPWLTRLPPPWRIEVRERVDANGIAVEHLTQAALDQLLRDLAALPQRPDAVAVCLLFAHRNPVHELAIHACISARLAGVPVALSHQLPATTLAALHDAGGEFERTVATMQAAHRLLGTASANAPPQRNAKALPASVDAPPAALDAQLAPPAALDAQLEHIANDIEAHMIASAVSSVVREARDCACALFLPDGRLLAQASSLPLLLGSLSHAVAGITALHPVDTMADGDSYLTNDPWSGGTHLPDMVLLRPVFAHGRVSALAAAILHHQDVGGITAGSVPTDATSVLQEGLRLPPVQMYRAGLPDPAWLALLRANSRMPDNLSGDLAAQWSALTQGAAALTHLIEVHGPSFESAAEGLIAASEVATRAALAAAPDGDYAFSDALDGDGLTSDAVPLEVCLRKRGGALTIDLTRCAAQTRGPVNASPAAVWAAVSYFARTLAPHAASNHGGTAPVTLITAPATIVNPAYPAAVNARTNLVKLLANALLGAWALANPARSPAPNAGVAVVLALSGARANGSPWMFTEIIASAAGGAPWQAGGSGVSTDVGNARNTPAESIEAQAPIRVERIGLHQGSGGAGVHRGGDGICRSYLLLEGEGVISYRGERHHQAARGAAGGAAGAPGRARIERASGEIELLTAKCRAHWRPGDRLVIETAGGGGWGVPGPAVGAESTLDPSVSPSSRGASA